MNELNTQSENSFGVELEYVKLLPKGEDEPVFVSENILVVLPEAEERGQVLGLLIDDLYGTYFKDASVGDTITIGNVDKGSATEDLVKVDESVHMEAKVLPKLDTMFDDLWTHS